MISLYRLSLKHRLMLIVMIPAALLASGIAGLFMARSSDAANEALNRRALAIVSFLAPAAEYGVISGNRNTLLSLTQAVLEQRNVTAVVIHDADGELLAYGGRPQYILNHRETVGINSNLNGRLIATAPVLIAPLHVLDPFVLSETLDQAANDEPIGWVHVELDTAELEALKKETLITTLFFVMVGLALTGILAVRLAQSVDRPIGQLVNAVRRMSDGELGVEVPEQAGSDELRTLERGFNQMSRSMTNAQLTLQTRVDEATAQLAYQAMHDPLTGLPNRRAFEQALEDTLAASRRSDDHGALCFMDLDRFKIVNDTCGHAAGDELLRRIAALIRQRVRAQDLIARIGGDEFALILRGCDAAEAQLIAENLRESISSFRFNWEGRRFTVGASIGLVPMDGSLATASDVLVAADLACYSAKKSGRNRVVLHEAARVDGRRSTDPKGYHHPDHSAPLTPKHLHVHRQTIVPLQTGQTGPALVEIFLRIDDGRGGFLNTGEQLANIESDERAIEIDLWVAEEVCRHYASLSGARTSASPSEGDDAARRVAATSSSSMTEDDTQFSLNLGRASLMAGTRYLAGLQETLRRYRIARERVLLEFRADVVEQAPAELAQFAIAARALGCRIAIERLDGSSAGLLNSFAPDYVKISIKSLIEAYGFEAGCSLAQALCGMAKALAILSVASEIEDPLLRDALREYGFDFAQGNAISSAVALEDAEPARPLRIDAGLGDAGGAGVSASPNKLQES